MQDIALYQQILGLNEPWKVHSVELRVKDGEVVVRVECTEKVWGCPHPGCAQRMHVHEWETRRWRHLDSCQFKTILEAEVPRLVCAEHGSLTLTVPWAEKHGRFTALFERLAIDVLRECSISAACGLLRISWDEADGIKQRAVERGLARKEPRVNRQLCVDEKSVARGQHYVTVVARVDAEGTTVEYVGEDRKQESLDAFWRGLKPEQLQGIEAVAMDMWEPYVASTKAAVPDGAEKIVHDPFHMIQHMNNAVNDVRKAEHRQLRGQGDNRLEGTRWDWLHGMENIPDERRPGFDALKFSQLKTARAWTLKEMLRTLWTFQTEAGARRHFGRWYSWAIRSRLEPVKKVARMLQRRVENIINYCRHRLSNGPLEGLNNKIQGLTKKAYGYRNVRRFMNDIYFHCGGLNLYPAQ
jgi:transposase